MNHEELQDTVRKELGPFAAARGHAVYSGASTWRQGRFYVMGYNPATDDTNEPLDSLSIKPADWSLYLDKCWYCGASRNEDHRHQLKPHQKRVLAICQHLGTHPRAIFATNAIFVESRDAASLRDKEDLWERCWQVHLHFLKVVRPEWIICLGNAVSDSAFALLKKKIAPKTALAPSAYRDGRTFAGAIELAGEKKDVKVLGVPHPSRFPVSPALKRLLNEISVG